MDEGEFLWAIGGKVENKYTVGDTTVYNINRNRWYSSESGELAPMIHPVQGAGWTFFDNKIFCFGGKTKPHSGCSDYVQVYKIEEDVWELYNRMPEPRSKLGKFYPVIENRFMYLFGGDNAQGRFNRVNWNWIVPLKSEGKDFLSADVDENVWLYGTLGISRCLYLASKVLKNHKLEEFSEKVFLSHLSFPFEERIPTDKFLDLLIEKKLAKNKGDAYMRVIETSCLQARNELMHLLRSPDIKSKLDEYGRLKKGARPLSVQKVAQPIEQLTREIVIHRVKAARGG